MANKVIGTASDLLTAVKTWVLSLLSNKVDKVDGKGLSTNDFTTTYKNKLDGITANATPNIIETVKVNGTALTPDANKAVNVTLSGLGGIPSSEKGSNNGVATLGSDGKVPSSQLPSYVDDVLEYDSVSAFPTTGEAGKIYVAKDTNKTYRWGGTSYVVISETISVGTTTGTAFDGKVGNDHVNNTGIHVTSTEKSSWNAKYQMPSTKIPKSDLATDVQTSLGKADTALQAHQSLAGYVPTSRKVAGKALTSDITLVVADISDLQFMTPDEMANILNS